MAAYYNEWNRKSAAALRQLIADGLIAPGDVDERSILDVTYDDIKHYTQCHFFAGIGGWSLALRMAGWPDHRPVWTGSCPCQPFSEAGGRLGLADERHLWPYWFELISQRGDGELFGEQVDAAIRYGWLDLVRNDLEGIGHAIAAVGLPAACVGAPHIRQRLWFVADRTESGRSGRSRGLDCEDGGGTSEPGRLRDAVDGVGRLADASGQRFDQHAQRNGQPQQPGLEAPRGPDVDGRGQLQLGVAQGDAERTGLAQRLGLAGIPGWALGTGARQAPVGASVHADRVADTECAADRREAECADHFGPEGDRPADWSSGRRGALDAGSVGDADSQREDPFRGISTGARVEPAGSPWDSAIWIDCRDGKRRPIEPSIFPLAHGVSERVGLLHGSGNAIVPQVAAAFIQEYLATRKVIV